METGACYFFFVALQGFEHVGVSLGVDHHVLLLKLVHWFLPRSFHYKFKFKINYFSLPRILPLTSIPLTGFWGFGVLVFMLVGGLLWEVV